MFEKTNDNPLPMYELRVEQSRKYYDVYQKYQQRMSEIEGENVKFLLFYGNQKRYALFQDLFSAIS